MDGTLMFNMLKPFKNAAPAASAPAPAPVATGKVAPGTPAPAAGASPTVVSAAVDAPPAAVAAKRAAPPPPPPATPVDPDAAARHPGPLAVPHGSGEANPAAGEGPGTPAVGDEEGGGGGNYTALRVSSSQDGGGAAGAGTASPAPPAGASSASGASVASRGNPTPTARHSRSSVASGGGFNESRASVGSSAMSVASGRQGDYTPMAHSPGPGGNSGEPATPSVGAVAGQGAGAGSGAAAAAGGGGVTSTVDADDAAERGSTMDAHEEVKRAAVSAGVPIVKREDLELGRPVGQGSYGKVYAGVWRGTDVAVKMLKGTLSADDLRAAHAEVIKELKTMRRVGNHKNVVSLLGVCMLERPMRLCIVTDLMSRGSLLDVLRKGRVKSLQDITRIASQIAAGMSHLHGEGVVHRDLAARNVLVDEHYNVRVGDFGYARLLSNKEGTGQTAATVGPVRWMSPESMHKQYSARSDVWAFGVTL